MALLGVAAFITGRVLFLERRLRHPVPMDLTEEEGRISVSFNDSWS